MPGRSLVDIADQLDRKLAKGAHAGFELCAQIMQVEVVKRCPVLTGQLKAAFSSPDAVGKNEDGKWAFGLLTPELRREGYYWQWVEYGTKANPPRTVVSKNLRTGRRYRRAYPGTSGRSPHPFFRPGVAVARAKFSMMMGMAVGLALGDAMPGVLKSSPEGPTIGHTVGLNWAREVVNKSKGDDRL